MRSICCCACTRAADIRGAQAPRSCRSIWQRPRRRAATPRWCRTLPYAIVASVFNLDSRDQLDDFMEAFGALSRSRLVDQRRLDRSTRCCGCARRVGAASRRASTVASPARCDRLLERLPRAHRDRHGRSIRTAVSARAVEGSSVELDRYVGDFQQSGAAAVCPRLMIEPDGFLTRFQAFEYALGFRIGRRSLADFSITSGVSLYRRDALECALERAFAVGVRGGSRKRAHPAEQRRAHLLRRPARYQYRGPGLLAALVFTARRLVLRPAQGLHRALRRSPPHPAPRAVRALSLPVLHGRIDARTASGEDGVRRRCCC